MLNFMLNYVKHFLLNLNYVKLYVKLFLITDQIMLNYVKLLINYIVKNGQFKQTEQRAKRYPFKACWLNS